MYPQDLGTGIDGRNGIVGCQNIFGAKGIINPKDAFASLAA